MKHALQTIHQAPASAVRVFDLTGTSIKKTEETTCDCYTGPLSELLAVGIVREDQLPSIGSSSISWLRGERMTRGKARKLGETYLRIVVRTSVAIVGVGVPFAVRQERQKKQAAERAAYRAKLAEEARGRQAGGGAEAVRKAMQALNVVPRTKEAYLRAQAKAAKNMMDMAVQMTAEGLEWHGGWRIDSDSLEEIQTAMDGVLEAFLNAQVIFDAERQAKVISERQRNLLEADATIAVRLRDLTKPNAALLRGEAA